MNQHEAIFEAPAAHESAYESHYSNPYSSPESAHEFEWELQEGSHHEHPEAGYESDRFLGGLIGGIGQALGLGEAVWETAEANPYGNPEALGEDEWESNEADPFFGKAFRALKSGAGKVAPLARHLAPIAKRLAPMAARALGGMIPGVGAIAGPLAGKLVSAALREGALEAEALEAQMFSPEAAYEVAESEAAHEAALTELLAHEATLAESESEAASVLAGTLPITITIMGGRRALRPVMPALTQANARLVRVLRSQGPAGRQLLRAVPSIQRRAVATLRAAARRGQPISGPLAVRAMAAASHSVLNSPRQVQRAVERNAIVRQRVAPPNQRRASVFVPSRVAPPHPRRAAGSYEW